MYKKLIGLGALLVLFTTGCINYQYKGEQFTPTEKANVYENAKNVPDQKYLVMGKCVASARYDEVTREEMYIRLQKEAEKKGADAVLVTAYQIVPTGFSENSLLNQDSVSLWSEGSVTNSGWNQLYNDFDQYYGQVGKKDKGGTPLSYTRIVRASFLKYDKNLPKDFDMAAFEKKWHKWSKTLNKIKQPKPVKPPDTTKVKHDVVNFRDMN
jgi:hypothetical protein